MKAFGESCLMATAAALILGTGCANAPATSASGVRLVVTLRFNGPINDNYQYFFLIRNAADSVGQNGPIPVIQPPYLNGFATGLINDTTRPDFSAGFTDFVEYSRVQRQVTSSGYSVYHLPGGIKGDPNRDVFESRGEPDFSQPPNGGNLLSFELLLDPAHSRIRPNTNEIDPNNGQQPRFLQVNVVATTTTPHNPQAPDPAKFLDAFGDQHLGSGSFNNFITIDTTQVGRTYASTLSAGDPFFEPDNDTYPGPSDPGIELVNWSIQITSQ